MKQVFLSNLIKIKNTSIFKLIFIFPFICVILSLLFSSLGGKEVLSLTAETTVNLNCTPKVRQKKSNF